MAGVTEISGTFTADKIAGVDATQVFSGELDSTQLPPVNHEGRLTESLIPLKIGTLTEDNFTYVLEKEDLGKSKTIVPLTGSISERTEKEPDSAC